VLAVLVAPAAEAKVPKQTFQRLKALDDTLNRIRDGVANQNLGAPIGDVIDKAQAELQAVGHTFPPLGNNPKVRNFGEVQRVAANVDLFLDDAIANVGNLDRRKQSFDEAEKSAKELEDALRQADKPGHRSKATLEAESLRALMRGVRNEVADPSFSKDGLVEEIREVTKQKGKTLGQLPKVFGLRFITVFMPLEQVQNSLQHARVASTPKEVLKLIDGAIDAKLGLVQNLLEQTSCTINGDGKIKGTGGADVICGSGGKDTINGGGGADVIKAGGGADVVKGGAGNDTIAGGNGADTLNGGAGADTLNGGKGRDVVFGDAGPDEVIGGPGKDVVVGGPGEDGCVAGKGDIKARCGKGPACEAGSYTSPAHEITVPAVGAESKLEWFDTPILNHDYYRRRGYDSGGCDYSRGDFLARIDVIGGGEVIAWTYDSEPLGGGPPTAREVHSADWCPVPRPEGGTMHTCHIFRPQLGFPGPDGSDASLLKNYSVGVGYQALGGGEGVKASISISITWRLLH
jgi:hypothetical protein